MHNVTFNVLTGIKFTSLLRAKLEHIKSRIVILASDGISRTGRDQMISKTSYQNQWRMHRGYLHHIANYAFLY
ncbi:MAG: hypothetical protein ACI9C4_003134 [Paraglaciecola sp.]|jgi:hypothetical protein